MIDISERQALIDMAYNRETYGTKLPSQIDGQWVCPHCRFEDPEFGTRRPMPIFEVKEPDA